MHVRDGHGDRDDDEDDGDHDPAERDGPAATDLRR